MVVKTQRNASCFIINHHARLGSNTPSLSAQKSPLNSRASPRGRCWEPTRAAFASSAHSPRAATHPDSRRRAPLPRGRPVSHASRSGATPEAALTAALAHVSVRTGRRTAAIYPTQRSYRPCRRAYVRSGAARATSQQPRWKACAAAAPVNTGRRQHRKRRPATPQPRRDQHPNSRASPRMGQ